MKNYKVLTILKILFTGHPVTLEGRTWYLNSDNVLGVKMEHTTVDENGDRQIKPGSENLIYGVEWPLSRFIKVCNMLSDEKVREMCDVIKEEDTELLEVRSNKVLFDEAKRLGDTIGMLLAGMVQNDIFIEKAKLVDWGEELQQQVQKIIMHGNTIIEYIHNQLWAQYPAKNQEDSCNGVPIGYDEIPF